MSFLKLISKFFEHKKETNDENHILELLKTKSFPEILEGCNDFLYFDRYLDMKYRYEVLYEDVKDIIGKQTLLNIPLIAYKNNTKFSTNNVIPKEDGYKYIYSYKLNRFTTEHVISNLQVINQDCDISISFFNNEDEIRLRNHPNLYIPLLMIQYNDVFINFICNKDSTPDYFQLESKRYLCNIELLRGMSPSEINNDKTKHLYELKTYFCLGCPIRYKDYLFRGGMIVKVMEDETLNKNFQEVLYC